MAKNSSARQRARTRHPDTVDPAAPPQSQPLDVDEGNFLLGLIGGLLGGCLVLALVLRRGKTMTLNGAFLGFAIQVVVVYVASR
jgi:predicted lipid-binding transport protein (Tim44 family)